MDGSAGALAWDGERHEELWLGHRETPNEVLLRNPALMHPAAAARTHLPVAHAEGFADTFRELYRAVYADVARGGPAEEPDYPTFRAGHVENVLADAVARLQPRAQLGRGRLSVSRLLPLRLRPCAP